MIKPISAVAFVAGLLAIGTPARAQQPQMLSPGARVGNSIIPSTHSPGCGGVLCDSDDPRRVSNVPPPPCQGLLCGISPYGMAPPMTAAEAARAQAERAKAEAAAAMPAASPPPERSRKHRRAKAKSSKSVATRTADPTPTTQQATQ